MKRSKRAPTFPEIPAMFINTWENLDEPYGVKDLQSRFVYANQAYYRLLDLPAGFDITGRYDSELPAPTSDFAAEFQAHDRLVETLKKRKSSLEIHEFGHDKRLSAYFFDKSPLYDEGDNVIGTIFHGRLAEHLSLRFYSTGGKPESIILTAPDGIFTDKEWELIFLLRQRHSLRECSGILGISQSAVDDRLRRIYDKKGVRSVKELIDFVRFNNWHTYVPARFITSNHIIL